MILETGTMRLLSIREVRKGNISDVLVCAAEGAAAQTYYTVWMIKDHKTAKAVLEDFCRRKEERPELPAPYLECFTKGSCMCFSFPYYQERSLKRFYRKEEYDRESRRRICLQLVAECMTSELPYSLLYLALVQDQIQLERDGTVRFQYMLDLQEYEQDCGEQDCIEACAELILSMLEEEGKDGYEGKRLIERKLERAGYESFRELYQDMQILGRTTGKGRMLKKCRPVVKKHKKKLFRVFMIIVLFLAVIALCMAVSELIWGEIPFLRVFSDAFETIGTESLLQ
ncbi:MAG: hypothetical protein J6B10_03085 [Lachnospiraceae bacterium]|nr:hypothetical protein [Lachnospiraceae bacterium]